jgi:heme/copper-type cytochrome/quinol oxidase subunit 1
VSFTAERVIVVYFPLQRYGIDMKKKSKQTAVCLLVIALFLYSFSLITSGIDINQNLISSCVTFNAWPVLAFLITFGDAILTIALPFFLILTLNLLIIVKLLRKKSPTCNSSNVLSSRVEFIKRDEMFNVTLLPVSSSRAVLQTYSSKIETLKYKSYARTARMLTMATVTFLILRTPMMVNKFGHFLDYSSSDNEINSANQTSYEQWASLKEAKLNEEIFERLVCYIYYLNFPFNFYFYVFNKTKFKNIFLRR